MRSFFGLMAGATLLLLVSCTADLQETIIPHVGDVIELTAYADNGVATKTGIVDNGNGGKNVVWKAGNAISLFFNSGDNGGNKFTTTDSGPVATFKGSISAISGSLEESGGKAYFWGLYPYNASASCDGTNITTTLPSSQLAYQGDVADDLLVTVGRSENLAMSFKNACAVIGFTLSQDNISKVTFSGRNNEYVAGEFKSSFNGSNQLTVAPTSNGVKSIKIIPAESATFTKGKTYYFAILPGTFSSGYSLTFTKADGTAAIYTRTTSFTFAISTFYTMTNKDSGLTFTSGSISSEIITFADSDIKDALVNKFDTDGDGDLSKGEAAAVTSFEGVFGAIKTYKSFDEFQYFTSITYIFNEMFSGWNNLTSIKLPESIRRIDAWAFKGCTSLKSIVIPNSVTSIGLSAFENCTSLTSIVIPNRVTSIGNYVFMDCTSLSSIKIPNSVQRIGDNAFYNCTNLSRVDITDFEAWCNVDFDGMGSNPLFYAHHLYLNDVEITSLTIPNSVTSIGGCVFSGWTSLTDINIPNSVTSIGGCALFRCTGLTSIVIPNSVTSIGNSAFLNCTGLTSIVISNSVTSIGAEAFYGCSNLSSVTIPKSVTSIKDGAFFGCTGLTSVTVMSETPSKLDMGSYNYNIFNYYNTSGQNLQLDIIIYVPKNSVDTYKTATGWSDYASKIQAIPE